MSQPDMGTSDTSSVVIAAELRMVIIGDPFPTELLEGRASEVAHELLGANLVVDSRSGRIVEVEAYEGGATLRRSVSKGSGSLSSHWHFEIG